MKALFISERNVAGWGVTASRRGWGAALLAAVPDGDYRCFCDGQGDAPSQSRRHLAWVGEAMPHILVVEDDQDIREDLAFLLRRQGFEVTTAANGLDALEQVRTDKPCVILLDLMMPVMDGWQFRTRQLAEPSIAAVPVIVISGVADRTRHPCELNAAAMLAKPIQMERLLAAVKRVC